MAQKVVDSHGMRCGCLGRVIRDGAALCCAVLCWAYCSDMERRHLQDKEKMRKEAAAKIRETKVAMAQLAGLLQSHTITLGANSIALLCKWHHTCTAVESFLKLSGMNKCWLSEAACAQHRAHTGSTPEATHLVIVMGRLPTAASGMLSCCWLADQHLESSTKRTLVENETMVAELAYHTAQVGATSAVWGWKDSRPWQMQRESSVMIQTDSTAGLHTSVELMPQRRSCRCMQAMPRMAAASQSYALYVAPCGRRMCGHDCLAVALLEPLWQCARVSL